MAFNVSLAEQAARLKKSIENRDRKRNQERQVRRANRCSAFISGFFEYSFSMATLSLRNSSRKAAQPAVVTV